METRREYSSMVDVERCHRGHFFDASAKRFFRSRTGTTHYDVDRNPGYALFTTSEKGPDDRRRYTVRMITPAGVIETVGGFQAFASGRGANDAAKRWAALPGRLVDILKKTGDSAAAAAEGITP